MISKHSLEVCNFSIDLPVLISRIQFVKSSIVNAVIFDEFNPKDDFYLGAASILEDVCVDIEQINEAMAPLYRLQGKTQVINRELDIFSDFLNEYCTIEAHLIETAKNLYDRFSDWWMAHISKNIPDKKTIGLWMDRGGFSKVRKSQRGPYVFQGLQLIDVKDEQ